VKLSIKSILKIILPLGFGVFVVYLFFSKLSDENIAEIKDALASANYLWLVASGLLATFAQFIRALRWRMLVKSLGYDITLIKSFNAISMNYLINLGIPRAGEFARCGVLAKYDNIPIQKSIGTLVNERITDLLMLGFVGLLALLVEYQLFVDFAKENIMPSIDAVFGKLINLAIIGFVAILLFATVYYLYKKGKLTFLEKIKHIVDDLLAGVLSIRYMEKPMLFIFLTFVNWSFYWLMIYVVFFTLPAGSELTISAALMVLFFGTFAFIVVQGGLGVYPIIVGLILVLYGIPNHIGNTLGWLMWIGQTVFIFIMALFALPFFIRDNKKKT
jgi:uncharacterized protein (TIRG00374 family)